jgi:hypothetical protein
MSPTAREKRLLVLLAVVLVPLVILAARVAATSMTTDFYCFWSGSSFVLQGHDPYDESAWTAATSGTSLDAFDRLRGTNCYTRYLYPLTTAIAMAPIALLPLGVAAALWEIAIFVGALAGSLLLAKAARLARHDALTLAVLVAISLPFEQTVMAAQFGGLALFAAGLLAAPRIGAARAATAIVFAALKPHLLPIAVLARLWRMPLRTVALASAPIVVLAIVSLFVDPTWPGRWLGGLGGDRRNLFAVSVSVWTLGAVTALPLLPVVIVVAALVLLAVAFVRRRPLDALDAVAIGAVAWQVVVPYGLVGDQMASLALCWAAIYRRIIAQGSVALTAALFTVAGILPWILYATRFDFLAFGGLELSSTLVPPATALVLAVALLTVNLGAVSRSDAE